MSPLGCRGPGTQGVLTGNHSPLMVPCTGKWALAAYDRCLERFPLGDGSGVSGRGASAGAPARRNRGTTGRLVSAVPRTARPHFSFGLCDALSCSP